MSSTSTSDDDNDENRLNLNESQLIAAQKSLIYKHPLFPVLVYVLERCEQATLNPPLLSSTIEENSTNSFEENLKLFLAKNPNLFTNIKDEGEENSSMIDHLYIDAMQVLRIHLLELDKVNDLCRDFCQRYIACLKVKLNANNIFTDDEDDDDEDDDYEDEESTMDDECNSSDEDEQMMFNSKHLRREAQSRNPTQFTGQTPLSQIIASGSSPMPIDPSSSTLFDSFCPKRRKSSTHLPSSKRGVLPKSATSIMRSWLFQHIVHPYPTEDEKRAISQKTNLSLLQVNNWFINARRRILQPMLEASNPDLAANKKKKRSIDAAAEEQATSTVQNRQMSNINRYWPSNLVQFDLTTMDPRKK